MPSIETTEFGVTWRSGDERLLVEAWGDDAIRVRVSLGAVTETPVCALLDNVARLERPTIGLAEDVVRLRIGRMGAELSLPQGRLRFFDAATERDLLAETGAPWPGSRRFVPLGSGTYRLEQRFAAYEDERIYGLGQHGHGLFDQKGTVTELVQRNGEVSIPFALSSRGYGLLWNNPAIGRVELARNATCWVAEQSHQIDYWITAGTPAEILAAYASATGHAPEPPAYTSGYWQSKLRYESQDALLEVAREYHRRDIPLAVIVADYFAWTHMGDWRFDPAAWPDPAAMVRELSAYGTELMVSVWPTVSPLSENYAEMLEGGLLVRTENGPPVLQTFPDYGFGTTMLPVSYYDATDAEARRFVWDRLDQNYRAHGIRAFWLDASEPEINPEQFANLRFSAGPGLEVGNVYPRELARAVFDGLSAAGEASPLVLIRSAWAGSQRYGIVLWSGDIPATWDSLSQQIRAGLNVALSGIPLWTTDIGGFHGGDPTDAEYRELYVRWFQFATFCPVMRAHGHREPRDAFFVGHTGGPNEVWAYGEQVEHILVEAIRLRERLRPYIDEHLRGCTTSGLPLLRPLLLEFPDDDTAWLVDDQFMFGPDLLVAPVAEKGALARSVYLPLGASWRDPYTDEVFAGGSTAVVAAPIERIPVFLRADATLPIVDSEIPT